MDLMDNTQQCEVLAFNYTKIDTVAFRLLSFISTGPGSRFGLKLVVQPLKTGARPNFHAISYVWGDESIVDTVLINGQVKGISRTLVHVLTTLRQRLDEKQTFWIDALCINQLDEKEKAFQIHFMGPIYKFADTVHVFTGFDHNDECLTAREVSYLSDRFSEPPPPGFCTTNTSLLSRALPSLDETIWYKVQTFFEAPWFRRLWVVQEAVLANHIILHLSDGTVSWDQLIELLKRLRRYSLHDFLDRPVPVTQCRAQVLKVSGRVAMLEIEVMRKRQFSYKYLHMVLMIVRTKLCRDPIDRVYAWYWLLTPEMQTDLTPRHLISSAIPYWRPFIELSHIALSTSRDLQTIPLACTINRLPQLPSWCINIESDVEVYMYVGDSCSAGGGQSSEVGAHIATSRDGLQLYLQGIRVGRIAKKFEPRWLICQNASPHAECATNWMLWMAGAIDFVKANSVTVEELLRSSTLNGLRDSEGVPTSFTDLGDHFKSLVEHWSQCAQSPSSGELTLNSDDVLQISRLRNMYISAMQGRRLYLTDMGRVCLAHQAAEVGDTLCVFEGARAVFVLRSKGIESESHQGTYTFVSDAWVHGFMNAEAFQSDLPRRTFILV